MKPTKSDMPAAHFEIGGVSLDSRVADALQNVERQLGKAQIMERGDASTGRSQACYVSTSNRRIYLIFEQGELDLNYYLFQRGRSWSGQELCTPSSLVTPALGTRSGLRLGLSRAKVERILGKPDFSDTARLVYRREVKKHASDDDLAYSKKAHPEMSDKEIHENFDYYDVEIYIEARFTDGHLTYLAVSKAETD